MVFKAAEELKAQLAKVKKGFQHVEREYPNMRPSLEAMLSTDVGLVDDVLAFVGLLHPSIVDGAPILLARDAIGRLPALLEAMSNMVAIHAGGVADHGPQVVADRFSILSSRYNDVYSTFTPLLAARRPATFDRELIEAREDIQRRHKHIAQVEREADQILEAIRTASATIGTSKYAEIFFQEWKEYEKRSRRWLAFTLFGALASIVLTIWVMLRFPLQSFSSLEVVSFVGSKLFVISVLYILLALFMKNYSANKHNAVLNKHRSSALSIFESLTEGTKDTQTKDAILRHATEAIFSMQKTGFLGKEPVPSGVNKIIETITRTEPKSTS